jgi:predicted transglutaminase-like cysteine proteinase
MKLKFDWIYNLIYREKDELIDTLFLENNRLRDEIPKHNIKEIYYNNKYPKVDLTYKRIETDGTYQIDLRNFINPNDANIPIVIGETDDEKALQGLKWVVDNIKYVSDISGYYKSEEYWAYNYQTLKHKEGDCEDGAITLYNILIKSGVPYWKLRLSAGYVINPSTEKKEGHCYLTYYCEEKDYWVVLDWCWYPNLFKINERKDYKDEVGYSDVWFSWNQRYCYSQGLNTGAKRLLNLR